MNENGEAQLTDVSESFSAYYEQRKSNGLPAEKKACIFLHDDYTQKQVESLILSNPFKRFEDMGFMHHSKHIGIIKIDRSIMNTLDDNDISDLLTYCDEALDRYWGEK